MAKEINEIAKTLKKKLWEKNLRVCGAVNGEPRMGEGILYIYLLYILQFMNDFFLMFSVQFEKAYIHSVRSHFGFINNQNTYLWHHNI